MNTRAPGTTVEVSTATYKGRRFTVIESDGEQIIVRGTRGARRVLTQSGDSWSIREDDDGRNRTRPCTVRWSGERETRPHRPLQPQDLARLMLCETAKDLAEWVINREASHACTTGDPRAADTAAAMRLYLSAMDIRGQSQRAAGGSEP